MKKVVNKPKSTCYKRAFPRITCCLSTTPGRQIGSNFPHYDRLMFSTGLFYGYIHYTEDQKFIFEVDRTKELVDITDYVEIKY